MKALKGEIVSTIPLQSFRVLTYFDDVSALMVHRTLAFALHLVDLATCALRIHNTTETSGSSSERSCYFQPEYEHNLAFNDGRGDAMPDGE